MSEKEREIFEFEMVFKKYFLLLEFPAFPREETKD